MITLAIDSSTYRGTVAVLHDGDVVATADTAMRGMHSEGLMPAVVSALADARVTRAEVGRVICGGGPGSFTSLRIGASIAKGIAMGARVPLFAVSSLGLSLASFAGPAGHYLVTLDAMRDEWYVGLFSRSATGEIVEEQPVIIVPKADLFMIAETHRATIIGGAAGNAQPHASGCLALMQSIEQSGSVDLDRWEPSYGRLAEAQVKWEAAHGRSLTA